MGIVTHVNSEKFTVLYKTQNENIEETLPINSNRIAEIGKYTMNRYINRFSNPCDINSYLCSNKKIFNSTKNQEINFRDEIKNIKMKIVDIQEDGNCLYRSIAHQLYGNENLYHIIKNYCMVYLEIEKEFFSQFIDGGLSKFDEYLDLKRKEGNFTIFY